VHVTPQEEERIGELVAALEARTGVQVLAAVVGKSDVYPEAPWKAFALAASLATLVLAVRAVIDPPWLGPLDAALAAGTVLGVGTAAALLTTLLPPFARLFLPATRLEAETDQYARALFLEREVFRTARRTGVLLFVSLFERRVVILPDAGVAARLDGGAMAEIVARMTPHLARGDRCNALVEGIAALEAALRKAGFAGEVGAPDEIRDELIQEKGAQE